MGSYIHITEKEVMAQLMSSEEVAALNEFVIFHEDEKRVDLEATLKATGIGIVGSALMGWENEKVYQIETRWDKIRECDCFIIINKDDKYANLWARVDEVGDKAIDLQLDFHFNVPARW